MKPMVCPTLRSRAGISSSSSSSSPSCRSVCGGVGKEEEDDDDDDDNDDDDGGARKEKIARMFLPLLSIDSPTYLLTHQLRLPTVSVFAGLDRLGGVPCSQNYLVGG